MKAIVRHPRKALDYFTYTIIPHQALRAVAIFSLRHGVLIFALTAGLMAVVRQLLAN